MTTELQELATRPADPAIVARPGGETLERPALRSAIQTDAKSRARRRGWKRGLLAAGLVGLIGLLALALRPRPVEVETGLAQRSSMRVTIDEDGLARIRDRYVVSAPVSGRLERIELHAGDQVRAGDPLARILSIAPPMLDERARREAQARLAMTLSAEQQAALQIERAELRHVYARDDAARKRSLEQSGALAPEVVEQADLAARTAATELESLRFGRQIANHEVGMARAALQRMTGTEPEQLEIRSPVAGKILRVVQQSEGVVQAGSPLLEVGDPNALEIAVDVLTSDAVRVRPSGLVLLERWGGPTLESRVRWVEPSAFTRISALGVEEQRVNVIVDLTAPRESWHSLSDGYRVEARIVVWDASDVLQVPGSAVFRHDGGWASYRVVDGVAKLTPIEIGERTPQSVQVLRGLTAGERLVLHPSDQVREGAAVRERER